MIQQLVSDILEMLPGSAEGLGLGGARCARRGQLEGSVKRAADNVLLANKGDRGKLQVDLVLRCGAGVSWMLGALLGALGASGGDQATCCLPKKLVEGSCRLVLCYVVGQVCHGC
jgi:hypothetical protein